MLGKRITNTAIASRDENSLWSHFGKVEVSSFEILITSVEYRYLLLNFWTRFTELKIVHVMTPFWTLFVLLLSWTLFSVARSKEETRCIGWRATSNCSPHAIKNPKKDRSCKETISKGESGFCECEGRRRVRESRCDHHPFTCEEACKVASSAELSCESKLIV